MSSGSVATSTRSLLRIDTLEIMGGTLSRRALMLVIEWAMAHRAERVSRQGSITRGEEVRYARAMALLLGPWPVYVWLSIAAAAGLLVALVLWLAGPPREVAGVDFTLGEPATLSLMAAPASTLRVWGTYDVDGDADPEEGEVRVTFEARSAGRVVAAGAVDPVGWRCVHRGRSGRWAFTAAIATVPVTEGALFEVRVTVTAVTPVVAARLYVSR